MKKKFLVSAVTVCLVAGIFAGCGQSAVKTEAKLKTLAEYKGLEVEKSKATVEDSSIETQLTYATYMHQTTEKVTQGKVKDKDNVNIDYTGKIDGKEFDGGSATGSDLTIGSGSFIDGFESGLIGKKIGDTVSLDLKFPDPYTNNPDLAGKAVTFEVKINYVSETKTPEMNDDFVKKYYSYVGNTVADLKKYFSEQTKQSQIMSEVWSNYVDKCEVESYDSEELASTIKDLEDYQEYQIYSKYYADLDTYLKAKDQSKDDWNKDIEDQAKNTLKEKMIINAIADKEGISVDDSEYKEQAAIFAEQYTYENVSALESANGKDSVKYTILRNDVYKMISENIKVVADKETTTEATTTAKDESETTTAEGEKSAAETTAETTAE